MAWYVWALIGFLVLCVFVAMGGGKGSGDSDMP